MNISQILSCDAVMNKIYISLFCDIPTFNCNQKNSDKKLGHVFAKCWF